jgi:hypothetical protein
MLMKTIKRNTRLKNMPCYIEKMGRVAKLLGLQIDVFMSGSQNYLFHVNVDLDIIIQGNEKAIEQFEEMIEETEHKKIK